MLYWIAGGVMVVLFVWAIVHMIKNRAGKGPNQWG